MQESQANPTGSAATGYDHAEHENQMIAVYQDIAAAESVRGALLSHGVPASAIQVINHGPSTSTQQARDFNDDGFWGSMKRLFAPEEDTMAYSHAVGEGHALVVVTPDATSDRQAIIQVMEQSNPIDFDAKLNDWQQSGYDYSKPHASALEGAAATGLTQTGLTQTGLTQTGTSQADTTQAGNTQTTTHQTATPMTTATAATTPVAQASGDQSIDLVEERLRVGKREVAQGVVRIRSYVVERPVEEQVRLRQERVVVERHPVDRAATGAEVGAFQERTIEAQGFAEQAVVDKEVRVVEVIDLKKESSERVETVHDTVRKTEVEIEGDGTHTTTGR